MQASSWLWHDHREPVEMLAADGVVRYWLRPCRRLNRVFTCDITSAWRGEEEDERSGRFMMGMSSVPAFVTSLEIPPFPFCIQLHIYSLANPPVCILLPI